ncbi:hypothetical protein EC844_106131 [Acinetobacter calcoaceticus]|uniref:Uncharacterized protein n=1 Tax=Acinetobacter calcoaceticus TaxID=471 RepID=A0A4R1XUH8_ACICA|nr:hypothetical protein EC844_106131 [Acinetobacter calcoaceticus]
MFMKKLMIIFSLCFLWHSPVYAKGLLIFNTGEELFEISAFPKELTQQYTELAALKVGYKCSHFGILWADIRTWDCTLVAVDPADENAYIDLPEDIVAQLKQNPDYQENKMQRSFWNHYGIYFFILIIIGFIFIGRLRK